MKHHKPLKYQKNLRQADNWYNSILADALYCAFKNESYENYKPGKDPILKIIYGDAAETSCTIYSRYGSPGFFRSNEPSNLVKRALFLIMCKTIQGTANDKLKQTIKVAFQMRFEECFENYVSDSKAFWNYYSKQTNWSQNFDDDYNIENDRLVDKGKKEEDLSILSDNPYHPVLYLLFFIVMVLSGLALSTFSVCNAANNNKLLNFKYDHQSDIAMIVCGACLFVIGCYFLFLRHKYCPGLKSEVNNFRERFDKKNIERGMIKNITKHLRKKAEKKKNIDSLNQEAYKKTSLYTPILKTIKEESGKEAMINKIKPSFSLSGN